MIAPLSSDPFERTLPVGAFSGLSRARAACDHLGRPGSDDECGHAGQPPVNHVVPASPAEPIRSRHPYSGGHRSGVARRGGRGMDAVMTRGTLRAGWLAPFLLVSAIWGCSFMFIKVAVEALHPAYVAAGRVWLGAATLLVIMGCLRLRLPREPVLWGHLAVAAVFGNVIPFLLFAYAERQVPSIVAGLWNAAVPVTTMLAAWAVVRVEKPTRRSLAGLAVGVTGVAILLGPWQTLPAAQAGGHLACLGAVVSYAFAIAYTARHLTTRPEPIPALIACQFVIGSAVLVIAAPLLAGGAPGTSALTPPVVGSMVALGVFGSAVAYLVNHHLLRTVGPVVATLSTYLVPVFSTVAGLVVLGERLDWNQPVGGAVIVTAVAIAARPPTS
ncbi:DMT family transporter [Actinokineospora sp. 24-640]